MHFRHFGVLLAAAIAPALVAPPPAVAADAVSQRHIVFSVHQDVTVRKRVRQETDISMSFNNVSSSNTAGAGGGVSNAIDSTTLDGSVAVDIVTVTAAGALGCDVVSEVQGVRHGPDRVWIAPDGTVKWTDEKAAARAVTFLLTLLATHLIPNDAGTGTSWSLGREQFRIESIDGNVARLAHDATFGQLPARGGTETGWVDYKADLFVPARAELDVRGREETPTQSSEYRRHVTYALISDSKSRVK